NGDTVLVAPGTYAGRDANELRFGGKEITLRSESGAANTVLDNGRSGTVLIFDRAEPLGATVEGFTITGASRSAIQITGAACTIRHCIIEDNWNGLFGGGVAVDGRGEALLVDCVIDRNLAGQGGAVNVNGGSHARLEGCTLSRNRVDITG